MSAPSSQIVALTALELDTLHGAGPLAFQTYVLLRAWMDYRAGIVGRTRPVSLDMLRTYCETHTPRGAGTQIQHPSEKAIRTALDRLTRNGLLHRLHGERLAFRLPKALVASARPEQTRQGDDTMHSTEPGTTFPAPALQLAPEPGTHTDTSNGANRAHIKNQECLRVPQWLVDKIAAAGIDTHRAGLDLEALAAKAGTPEQLDEAIVRAKALRRRTGSTQGLNVGLLGSILKGTRGALPGWQSPTPAGRPRGFRQEIDSSKPPRPGESWNAYFQRIGRTETPSPHQEGMPT